MNRQSQMQLCIAQRLAWQRLRMSTRAESETMKGARALERMFNLNRALLSATPSRNLRFLPSCSVVVAPALCAARSSLNASTTASQERSHANPVNMAPKGQDDVHPVMLLIRFVAVDWLIAKRKSSSKATSTAKRPKAV
jgi:hypothetical protein